MSGGRAKFVEQISYEASRPEAVLSDDGSDGATSERPYGSATRRGRQTRCSAIMPSARRLEVIYSVQRN